MCDLRPFFLMILMPLIGCREGSLARECEPSDQVGCLDGQRCTLNDTGSPVCLPSNPLGYKEGAHCEKSEECRDGLGCLTLFGVPQCARFCALDQKTTDANAQCATNHPYAQCLMALPSRTDIGVCLNPCDPFARGSELLLCDQDQGHVCGVYFDVPFLTCQLEGAQSLWTPCSAVNLCREGLLCLQEGNEQRCVPPLAPGDSCPLGLLERPALGLYDPLTGGKISACWSSVSLPQSINPEVDYRLMLSATESKQEQDELCGSWGGKVAELSQQELIESLQITLAQTLLEYAQVQNHMDLLGVWIQQDELSDSSTCHALRFNQSLDETEQVQFFASSEPCTQKFPTLCELQVQGRLP